jgi:tetratricopeptide (TPR) repeat protein
VKAYSSTDIFLEEIALTDFPPDYYKIRVSLLDKEKNEILTKDKNFYISHVDSLPRPWISFILHPPTKDPFHSSIIGEQLLQKGELQKAKIFLEKAYHQNPSSLQFALSFSRVLFELKDYRTVLKILNPFLMKKNHEVLDPMARSYHLLGQYAKALSLYKEYLSHFGANFYILSFLGECYFQLGNKEEALRAWEKSLEMNPNQEELKKFVNSIKKEKDEFDN